MRERWPEVGRATDGAGELNTASPYTYPGEKEKKLLKKMMLTRMYRRDVGNVCRGASGVRKAWSVAANGSGECEERKEGSAWSTRGDRAGNVVGLMKGRVGVK